MVWSWLRKNIFSRPLTHIFSFHIKTPHASFQRVKIEINEWKREKEIPSQSSQAEKWTSLNKIIIRAQKQVAVCACVCVCVCVLMQRSGSCFVRPSLPVVHACRSWLAVFNDTSVSLWKPGPAAQRASSGYLRGLPRTPSPYQSRERGHISDVHRGERGGSCWETVLLLFTLDAFQWLEEVLFPRIPCFSFCHS